MNINLFNLHNKPWGIRDEETEEQRNTLCVAKVRELVRNNGAGFESGQSSFNYHIL